MNRSTLTLAVASFALTAGAALGSSSPVGDAKTNYTFHQPPVNALGVKGLSDLRGKPVLIEFWGTR
jgi:hypothetical protein